MRAITRAAAALALLALLAPAPVRADELPPEMPGAKPAAPAADPGAAPAPTTTAEPSAPARPPYLVLGLGAGAFVPTSKLGVSFLAGVDVSYQLPFLGGRFGLGVGLGYSQPTTSGKIADERVQPTAGTAGEADYSSTMRELLLDVRISYRIFSWDSIWSPHVAVGPAFYFLSHQVESLAHTQTETSTQLGFNVILGADFRVWRGAVIGEVRIPFATVGQRTTGDSNVGAASILVGYRFRI